jgi:hypothetical protein
MGAVVDAIRMNLFTEFLELLTHIINSLKLFAGGITNWNKKLNSVYIVHRLNLYRSSSVIIKVAFTYGKDQRGEQWLWSLQLLYGMSVRYNWLQKVIGCSCCMHDASKNVGAFEVPWPAKVSARHIITSRLINSETVLTHDRNGNGWPRGK